MPFFLEPILRTKNINISAFPCIGPHKSGLPCSYHTPAKLYLHVNLKPYKKAWKMLATHWSHLFRKIFWRQNQNGGINVWAKSWKKKIHKSHFWDTEAWISSIPSRCSVTSVPSVNCTLSMRSRKTFCCRCMSPLSLLQLVQQCHCPWPGCKNNQTNKSKCQEASKHAARLGSQLVGRTTK